jgi:hypothetical protein
MHIQVSGYLFDWPSACACCGEAPTIYLPASFTRTTGRRVKRKDTRAWQIPYCDACTRHVRRFETANGMVTPGLILCAVGPLALLLTGGVSPGAFWGVVALAFVLLLVVYAALRVRARAATRVGCSSVGPAVRYQGWDGSVHTFSMDSSEFGEAFRVANRRKVLGQPAAGEVGARQYQTRLRVERRGPQR